MAGNLENSVAGNFVFAIFRFGANDGARAIGANDAAAAAAGRAARFSHGVIAKQAALKERR
jgi:hypothetical protein